MKINENKVLFENIDHGQIFSRDGEYFMRILSLDEKNGNVGNAVNLSFPKIAFFKDYEEVVLHKEAVLNIGG